MKSIWVSLAVMVGYSALYLAVVFGTMYVTRRRRKTRWPFKESDRLLRGPGESLRRGLGRTEQELLETLVFGFAASALGLSMGWLTAQYLRFSGSPGLIVRYGPCAAFLFFVAWRISRLMHERWNTYLGWFGERVAAEKLQPLALEGYRIFHDVPANGAKKAFNIDHIVVGPPGLTVIEVKTRRKGNARPGFADHKVAFDGTKLVWPWGEDRHGIEQAISESDWLAKWVFDRTGLKVPVRAVLTLPGWWVDETPSPRLRVVNPQYLPDAVRGRWPTALPPDQIDLIARQLDVLCRDVEE